MKKDIYVVGAIITNGQKILCAQRGPDKSLANMWEFPGGKIEQGETAQDACKREIAEEMQCRIEVGEQVEKTVYKYDFGIVHLTTFLCTLIDGEPTLTEHTQIKWLYPNELTTLDWAPADIPATRKIVQHRLDK